MFDDNDGNDSDNDASTSSVFGGTHTNLSDPVDTDNNGAPDYIDINSDGDKKLDSAESYKTGISNTLSFTDPDGSAIDDQESGTLLKVFKNGVNNTLELAYREGNNAPVGTTQALTTSEDTVKIITLTGTDVDGDTLSYSIDSQPSNGSVTLSGATATYTPEVNYYGDDSFTFTVNDGTVDSAASTVMITVTAVNDAPVITGTPTTTIVEAVLYSFTPTVVDVDTEASALTFSITNKPSWATYSDSTGALTGTPTNDDIGETSGIVISVSDGELTAALPAFNLAVISANAVPVASDMTIEVLEDNSKTFSPEITDEEADDVLTIILKSQPSNGELTQNGNTLTYAPNANFFGEDSFTYVADDATTQSSVATVSLMVTSVNDLPIANDDTFSFAENAQYTYALDVLANDSDVEDVTPTLIGATTSIGSVTIDDGMLMLNTTASISGVVNIDYFVNDSDGAQTQATATVSFTEQLGSTLTYDEPADIEIDATGLATKVDVEPPVIYDSEGNRLTVTLLNDSLFITPGNNQLMWQVVDSNGVVTIITQNVNVYPLVSIRSDAQVAGNNQQSLSVYLNGESPDYPLTVPYVVTGDSGNGTHDLVSGEVIIESGIEAHIVYNTFGNVDVDENLVVTLDENLNLGANSSANVLITAGEMAPEATITVMQAGEERPFVENNDEPITIGISAGDDTTVTYTSDLPEGTVITMTEDGLSFSAEGVPAGIYSMTITVIGADGQETIQTIYVEVVDALVELGTTDTDGDGIPDNLEGYGDSDGDGIPDYLDSEDNCSVGPEQHQTATEFLVEAEAGVCLRKNILVAQNESGGMLLFEHEIPADAGHTNIGGLFGFVAYQLPHAGATAAIVLPQTAPTTSNAVYRKLINGEWVDFVVNDTDQIHSAMGERGYCPAPKSPLWTAGLQDGAWCVQLQITDGGPNDADGIANGSVVDPGGVASKGDELETPELNDNQEVDLGIGETAVVDVLDGVENGDSLTLVSAAVDFGTVTIVDGQLVYVPGDNFAGTATITYGVRDENGVTTYATLTIHVVSNNAPVANADSVSTTDRDALDIDVLGNDTDADGDTLTVISATVVTGQVTVNANGTLHYVPATGFSGVDTITYTIQDSKQAQATGQVNVTVTAYEVITITNESSGGSGGSVGGIALFMLALLAVARRRKLVAGYALLATSVMLSGAANADDMNNDMSVQSPWSLNASFGQARVHGNGITNTSEATQLSIDEITGTWSVGGFYQFQPNWQVGLRYIDLGEGELIIKGDTTNPAALHQLYASEAPTFATGVSLEVNYLSALTDNVEAKVLAGLYRHETEVNSAVEGRTSLIENQKETKLYAGAAIAYNVTDNADVFLQYSHYVMSDDDINEVSVGLSVSF